jgi:hypothetical protein
MMEIIRSWREQKILLKRKFPILSDEDFIVDDGNRESMIRRLEAKLVKTKAELELILAELQLL